MRRLFYLLAASLIPWQAHSTEYQPWFPQSLQIQSRSTYVHQNYNEVNGLFGDLDETSKDDFYTQGFELAYDRYDGELEITVSATARHTLGPDNIKLNFRYLILDDVIDDPISLAVGLTASQVFRLALEDVSSFHHGLFEGEFYISLGKECAPKADWVSRWWVVSGIGLGDHGSPWLHEEIAYERRFECFQTVRLFATGLFGLGGERLNLFDHFDGYGPIHHQSIDLGMRYSIAVPIFDATLSLEFARRVYAKNFPTGVNRILIQLWAPL